MDFLHPSDETGLDLIEVSSLMEKVVPTQSSCGSLREVVSLELRQSPPFHSSPYLMKLFVGSGASLQRFLDLPNPAAVSGSVGLLIPELVFLRRTLSEARSGQGGGGHVSVFITAQVPSTAPSSHHQQWYISSAVADPGYISTNYFFLKSVQQ